MVGLGWRCVAVVDLLCASVEVLGRTSTTGRASLERRVSAGGLARRKVVSSDSVLAVCLGEALLQHSIIVANNSRQLGMEVEQGI